MEPETEEKSGSGSNRDGSTWDSSTHGCSSGTNFTVTIAGIEVAMVFLMVWLLVIIVGVVVAMVVVVVAAILLLLVIIFYTISVIIRA